MEFWERDDKGCRKIATWDGKTWTGPGAKSVQSILDQYWPTLDGPFDPDKHWDKLEELISGSRLWAVVGKKEKESVSVDDLFPEETLSISEPKEIVWPLVVELGGPGSGHRGHKGVPGVRGGSAPGRGSLAAPVGDVGTEGTTKANDMLSGHSSFPGGLKPPWSTAGVDDRAELKAQVARDLAKEARVTEEQAADFIKQWAHSSNDDDMRSLAIQQDAADEFGLELSEFTQNKINKMQVETDRLREREVKRETKNIIGQLTAQGIDLETAKSIAKPMAEEHFEKYLSIKNKPLMDPKSQRSLLRAMYNKTQAEMKERGVAEVRVHRGVAMSPKDFSRLTDTGIIEGPVEIRTNVLSSWSLSKDVASKFAGSIGPGNQPAVFTSVVPVSRILSFSTTGFGCLTEGELTVLGGENDLAEVFGKWR